MTISPCSSTDSLSGQESSFKKLRADDSSDTSEESSAITLPGEMVRHICTFLSLKDCCVVARVSKLWNIAASHVSLLKPYCYPSSENHDYSVVTVPKELSTLRKLLNWASEFTRGNCKKSATRAKTIVGSILQTPRPITRFLTAVAPESFPSIQYEGLKSDGLELLKFLSGRGIAIDFSHTSDPLAHDILNAIDIHDLDLRVMASHSNFRGLMDQPRNLTDDLAKAIIDRKGLIGLNFYKKFLKTPRQLYEMIDYGIQLGAAEALAFGADFFCLDDLHTILQGPSGFFDEMSDSSKYPSILEGIRLEMGLSDDQLENIASKNALRFIANKHAISL